MSSVSPPLRRLVDLGTGAVRITFEGIDILAAPGESVAMALLGATAMPTRLTPVTNLPRAPFCLSGACFECLVEIDGEANVQACMTPVREGMRVRRQRGARRLADDAARHE